MGPCRRVENVFAVVELLPIAVSVAASIAQRQSGRLSTFKSTIPVRDAAGVPIDHELEFELLLQT